MIPLAARGNRCLTAYPPLVHVAPSAADRLLYRLLSTDTKESSHHGYGDGIHLEVIQQQDLVPSQWLY